MNVISFFGTNNEWQYVIAVHIVHFHAITDDITRLYLSTGDAIDVLKNVKDVKKEIYEIK